MKRWGQGFTLLEMLVVIVVISVLSGMVSLVMVDNPARQVRQQALEIIQLLQATRERAVLEGREYGLRLNSDSYQLMRLERSVWQALGLVHRLPQGVFMALDRDGQPLALSERLSQPQLLILSSDELSPFNLSFSSGMQHRLSVSSDGLGEPLINEN